jgi:O-antigen/teichoic acid export membrane protein
MATGVGQATTESVVLCFVLIPHLGTIGAAIAIAAALVVETFMLFMMAKRQLGFHPLHQMLQRG